jgi:hypothetical protein
MDSSSVRHTPQAIADIEAIESLVVDIVDISAEVVEELGKFGDTNERVVLDKCKILMNNAKVSNENDLRESLYSSELLGWTCKRLRFS